MLDRFVEFIKEKQLFEPQQKVLLAVSGGIDSMVLLHLFERTGFNYGIVHCNFQLRGEESDDDERFVKEQVLIHGVSSFFQRFETEEYARINGISIEMAARELRYNFFEKLRVENDFDYVATAHHQDDLVETFFLNLSRKTGIKGLTGIKEKTGTIIRPLLFASRKAIKNYARDNFVEYHDDSSNSEVVYQRNFLRHKILPLFSELNPAFRKNTVASIENLKEVERVYDYFISAESEKVISGDNNELVFSIDALNKSSFPMLVLLESLKNYNFNPTVIEEVYRSLESESGKRFYSKTHRLVKDRGRLFLAPLNLEEERIYYLEKDDIELFAPFDLSMERHHASGFKISREPHVACLDFDTLEFPLLIRKWQQGDYFQPLGMTGFKKLSDFFIDEKIPVHEKENIWLLCSGKNIVWIMGRRIDNRFKITNETNTICKIEIKQFH